MRKILTNDDSVADELSKFIVEMKKDASEKEKSG